MTYARQSRAGCCRHAASVRPLVAARALRGGCARRVRRTPAVAARDGAVSNLRTALAGTVSREYTEGATFLRDLGIDNPADVARILDMAMNPDSLFLTFRDKKRASNDNARLLSVEDDMKPAVDFLIAQGLQKQQLLKVVSAHPPVLGYSVQAHLAPMFDFLKEAGITEAAEVVAERPTVLGLGGEDGLRKIVEYLQANDYAHEDIVHYLKHTL